MQKAVEDEIQTGPIEQKGSNGNPNGEPQEYSRNIADYKDPGRYVSIVFLLYSCGFLFGVPSKVPVYREFHGIAYGLVNV